MLFSSQFNLTPDEVFDWLSKPGSFQDRESKFLTAEGYAPTTGDLATRWMKFLTAKGFTMGDLATRQKQWFLKNILASKAKTFSIKGSEISLDRGP